MIDPKSVLLRHMRVFIGVAETGQIRKAAERLHLDQSAVSRRMHTLERELEMSLFERRPDGLHLTAAGEILADNVRSIFRQIDESIDRARTAVDSGAGKLRIGFIERMARLPVFARMLAAFEEQFPDALVKLVPLSTTAQIEALRARDIDIGLLREPTGKLDDMEQRQLAAHDILLAVPRDYALAEIPSLSLSDLVGVPLLWPRRDVAPKIADALEKAFARQHIIPNVLTEIGTSESVIGMVAAGMGVGFVDITKLDYDPATVILKRVRDFTLPVVLELVWSPHNPAPLLRPFVEEALRAIDESDAHPEGPKSRPDSLGWRSPT